MKKRNRPIARMRADYRADIRNLDLVFRETFTHKRRYVLRVLQAIAVANEYGIVFRWFLKGT